MAKIKKTAEEGSIGFKQAAQVALFIARNWKIISTRKIKSISRLSSHRPSSGLAVGGRKPTSKGVTNAVKTSAAIVTASQ